jgi:hypothetical protein
MNEYPEVFANVAMKALADAKRSGIALVAHTMTCPDCVRFDDEDMTVKMCAVAKVLNNAYCNAFDIAKPYMAIIEADAQAEGL